MKFYETFDPSAPADDYDGSGGSLRRRSPEQPDSSQFSEVDPDPIAAEFLAGFEPSGAGFSQAPSPLGTLSSLGNDFDALSSSNAPSGTGGEFAELIGHDQTSPGASTAAAGNMGTTGTSTVGTTTFSQTVTYQSSGLVFNNTFGTGATTAFINDVDAAENYLQSQFGNACTVNCNFSVQSLNPDFSGENSFNPIYVTYSRFVDALSAHAETAIAKEAAAALANLPDPSNSALWEIPIGEARILGLAGAPGSETDDSVVLNSDYWTASALQNDPGDVEGVIEHELSEGIMGRIGSLGIADPGYWAPMDLFRFTASGQRDFTGGKDGQLTYFSVNGSNVATGLQYHNSVNSSGQFDGYDLADWDQVGADANATDPFGPGGPGVGDPGTLSATDIQIMEALGWAPPGQPPSVTAQNFLVASNQSVSISNYFTVSNPSGDNITQYVFEDKGGGNGHFSVNGVAQPDNQVITVSASNLSTVQYVGGSSPGTDMIEVGVYDATTDSYDWSSPFDASTPLVIQTDTNSYGSVSLAKVTNNYFLLTAGTDTGPALQYNGAPVTAGEFGAWVPIGAVQTATGYDVAWSMPGDNEYTVWNTDSSGNYISSIIGHVPGNNLALEEIELTFNQDLNGDGTIGPVTTVIQTDGSTTLSEVGDQYFLKNGSGPLFALQYNGAPVTAGEFGAWVPIGAVQTATGYDVAWSMPGDNEYTVWNTDSSGNYISNFIGHVPGNNLALEEIETVFGQDLNGDGTIGLVTTVIQTDGSTTLSEVGDQYFLKNGSGPLFALQYNGAPVTAGEFGAWVPIGAVQTATGYDVAWSMPGDNEYTVWNTDSSGNYISNFIGHVPGNNLALEEIETVFGQDLNGDGTIGLVTTVIQTDGSTTLSEAGGQYFLKNGSGPLFALQYNGAPVTAGEFGAWVPIGAVQTATGYDVAWSMPGDNEYTVWNTDSGGTYISSIIGHVPGNNLALEEIETVFGQDLNGDGTIGLVTTVIQTDGSTTLSEAGGQYFLKNGSGPLFALQYNGAPVTAGEFGAWVPIGAVQTATGYDVAWSMPGDNEYTVWSTDSGGTYISSIIGHVPGNNLALEEIELTFNQDLNGDGTIGIYAPSDSTLVIDQSLSGSTEAATIGAGATLELAAADSASVTFQSSTGTLALENPSEFSGEIYGFTGDGALSGSDQIDLTNIQYSSVHDSYSGGVLTVADGKGDSDTLDFSGSYSLSNFEFASNGTDGTILFDPPSPGLNDSRPVAGTFGFRATEPQSGTTPGSGQTTAAADFGRLASMSSQPWTGGMLFDHSPASSGAASLSTLHDEWHGIGQNGSSANSAIAQNFELNRHS